MRDTRLVRGRLFHLLVSCQEVPEDSRSSDHQCGRLVADMCCAKSGSKCLIVLVDTRPYVFEGDQAKPVGATRPPFGVISPLIQPKRESAGVVADDGQVCLYQMSITLLQSCFESLCADHNSGPDLTRRCQQCPSFALPHLIFNTMLK